MKNRCLLVLLFITINVFSQDPKLSDNFVVEVGEKYVETDGYFKGFYKYDNVVIAVNKHKDHLIIQKFDLTTLKEVDRVEHEMFFKDKKKRGFDKIMRLGDNVILFYEKWDRKNKIESLEAQMISLKSLEIGEQKEIIRQEGKIAGGKYAYKISFDENKLLIRYRLKLKLRNDVKNFDKIVINVFNENLELDWKEQVKMPYTEKKMNNGDYTIDREGDFYMLATVYEDDSTDERKKKEKDANYHLELFKVHKNTNAIIKNKIEIGDKFIDEVALYENAKGDIIIGGTCKNPDRGTERILFSTKKEGHPTGVFTINLTQKGGVRDFKSYDFPLALLNKHATKREKREINR